MANENSRDRIFKAVKQRINEYDEQNQIQMIANAIGDRRSRDLVDLVAKIESKEGWSTALDFLMKAQNQKYASPITIGQGRTKLEELKYREMIFELLSCSGFEPIKTNTIDLLKELTDESSLVDASHNLIPRLEKLAIEQIQSGDTLFFDFSENVSISQNIMKLLDQVRDENFRTISLEQCENLIDIAPLWYCEYGRLALSTLGIKGYAVDSNILDTVLSVIQAPTFNRTKTVNVPSFTDNRNDTWPRPTNSQYRKLHTHHIHHEINDLQILASRHSVPLLNTLLDEASSTYEGSSSTTSYKEILDYVNAHISIRSVDSILVLEKTSQMKNTRIATTAILAIGNFYHESSATTLVKLLCARKNDEIEIVVTKAIENVYKKCPEADRILSDSLDTECKNQGKLKKLYKRLRKEKPLYYQ